MKLPRRAIGSRLLALQSFLLCAALAPVQVMAQVGSGADSERGVAVIFPDTVRVGEAFDLGITAVSSDRLQFPAVLALPDELEQIGPPRSAGDSAGVWKAVYPLVAWKSGRIELPDVRVPVVSATTERSLVVRPPAVEVSSVLPPAEAEPRLQPPRMPSEPWSIPWLWLLALVLAAALVREMVRRRRAPPLPHAVHEAPPVDPLDEARASLLALRGQALAGEARTDRFYDGIECDCTWFEPGTGRRRPRSAAPSAAESRVGWTASGPWFNVRSRPGSEPSRCRTERSCPISTRS